MISFAAVLIASIALAPAALEPAPLQPGTQPKNILLIVLDDVGVDGIGVYGLGSDLPKTPIIDDLAGRGIRFLNVWSNPVCSPTRASIQTGRYSFRTGIGYTVVNGSQGLGLNEVAIPKMLSLSGLNYSTGMFGKWHLGNASNGGLLAPNVAGFDYYAGAMVNIHPPETYFSWNKTVNGVTTATTGYLTSDTVTDAAAWINTAQEPWFSQVAFHSAHTPYHAPPADLHSVDLTGADPVTNPRPLWKAMIEAMDNEIGRLLISINIDYSDTVVICLGDNGTHPPVIVPPFLPSHGKGTAYQGGVQVPFIVAGAGVVQGGQSRALINTTDLFSTIAELAGAQYTSLSLPQPNPTSSPSNSFAQGGLKLPGGPATLTLDSVSIVPYLTQPNSKSIRKFVFTDMFLPTGTGTVPVIVRQAIRDKRYKLMYVAAPSGLIKYYMFDLIKDPFELTNMLKQPELSLDQLLAFNSLLAASSQLLSSP